MQACSLADLFQVEKRRPDAGHSDGVEQYIRHIPENTFGASFVNSHAYATTNV
jgi:hypothetical protein